MIYSIEYDHNDGNDNDCDNHEHINTNNSKKLRHSLTRALQYTW